MLNIEQKKLINLLCWNEDCKKEIIKRLKYCIGYNKKFIITNNLLLQFLNWSEEYFYYSNGYEICILKSSNNKLIDDPFIEDLDNEKEILEQDDEILFFLSQKLEIFILELEKYILRYPGAFDEKLVERVKSKPFNKDNVYLDFNLF